MAGTRLADSAASVLEQFTGLTPDPEWAFAHLTQAQTSYATHGHHRYPAKFIPQLAARLIEDYSQPGDTVLDPFMGSGTALVEAKRLSRPSVGVDINPVAHLIATAKVRALEPHLLSEAIACVGRDWRRPYNRRRLPRRVRPSTTPTGTSDCATGSARMCCARCLGFSTPLRCWTTRCNPFSAAPCRTR